MKTKILLFALLCGVLNAADKQYVTVVDFPRADIVTFTMPAVPSLSYADGWFAAYIDGWTINEFHRRADELKDDDDQAELERIWADIKTLATNMESGWAKLTDEQKASMAGPAFWKRNVGLPRRLSRSQSKRFVEALSK